MNISQGRRPPAVDLEGAATTSVAVTCNGFIIIRLDVVERITSSARVGPGALRCRTRRVHRRPRHLCYDVGSSSVPTATSAAAAARARTTSARIWRGVELPVNLLAELSSRRGRRLRRSWADAARLAGRVNCGALLRPLDAVPRRPAPPRRLDSQDLITCTRPFARSAAQGFPSARLPSYTRGQTRVETTRAASEVQFSSSVGLAMIG